jgi:hypothetical protein
MPARIDIAMNPKNSKYNTVFTAFHFEDASDSLKRKRPLLQSVLLMIAQKLV